MTLVSHLLDHGCAAFTGKGPQPLLWVGLRATRVKITIRGVPNVNHCAGFVVYICIIYECDCGPNNTISWAAGWRSMG